MVCFKGFWHGKWAGAAAATLAVLALACGGGGNHANMSVSGKVTYTRRSLTRENGVPTGLSASYDTAQAARGLQVRAIAAKEETVGTGTATAYFVASTTFTNEYGDYTLSVPKDVAYFVEVQSIAGTTATKPIRIVSDTDVDLTNISAPTAKDPVDYTLYSLRKALDGTSDSANSLHASKSSGNVTVNFSVDSSTQWWIAASPSASAENFATVLHTTKLDSTAGSRVLGIIDSIYTFIDVYGDPSPGGTLDLFYRPSKADDARGSFVDYTDASHYYGSLRASDNDDAWDEPIIFMLCARNALYSHTLVSPYTPPSDQLPLDTVGLARKTGLDPVHALIDGMPYGMAASLLRSPYLADTSGTVLAVDPPLDIRNLTGLERNAYSGPSIAALSWNLLIKADGLSDTYSAWSKIDTESLRRFFTLKIPADSSSRPIDTASVYKQLLRLLEDPSSDDTVDLNNTFTDSTLGPIVSPFGLAWPRPATEASYLLDWGTDPDTSSAGAITFPMNMDSAHQDAAGTYPNLSKGEIVHAKFLMSKDSLYTLSVTPSSALPAGATLEVKILDASGQYLTFNVTGAGGTVTNSLMLDGDSSTYKPVLVHFRLKTGTLMTTVNPGTITVTLVPRAS